MTFAPRPASLLRATPLAAVAATAALAVWAALAGCPALAATLLGWHALSWVARSTRRRTQTLGAAASDAPPPSTRGAARDDGAREHAGASCPGAARVQVPAADVARSGNLQETDAVAELEQAWSRSGVGALLTGPGGDVLWANAGACTLFKSSDLVGQDASRLLPGFEAAPGTGPGAKELVAVCGDGTLRAVAVQTDRLATVAGTPSLSIVVDTSALQAKEHQLLLQNNLLQSAGMALFDAKTSAEEASRRKTQFLAYASHEIRTPLQAILGFAEQLDQESLPAEERREAIRIIQRNGEQLLTVLNDVLDLAQIESDDLELRFGRCDLRHEVDSVVQLFAAMARERGITIVVEERTDLPPDVGTDRARLRQILINLLGNAVRSTRTRAGSSEPARVRVVLEVEGSPPRARVLVEDHGPGMHEHELRRMFEPFEQAAAIADQKLGTGLGLAVSRRLAKLLGGDLVARSQPGVGTTVELTFAPGTLEPLACWTRRGPVATETTRKEAALQAHVLLAEDGRDNRLLIGSILRRAGLRVTTVEDGREALDSVAAAENEGRPFDAIVMDMQMPVMDGYEATASLRARGCTLPILALTADALADARQRCLEAGCDEYASKPIDRRGLVQALHKLLAGGPALHAGSATGRGGLTVESAN